MRHRLNLTALLPQRSTEQLTRYSTGTLEEEIDKTRNALTKQTVSEKIMSVCRSTIRWILLLDVVLAISVLALLAILEFGVIPPTRIGFFCNDPKISFKFRGDTVPIGLLIGASIVTPPIVMWLAEYACHASDSYDTVLGCAGSRIKQVWSWFGHYSIGLIVLAFICDVMKVMVGEPRPHFLDTCRPREALNCTNEYIQVYTCTNTVDSSWFILDSSRSFPSGHSAFSVYTSIFIVWYLQNRLSNRTFLLKPWLQCLMCVWGLTCSLTRIGDHRHHWWDVVVGDVLGFLFGLFVVVVPCRKFQLGRGNASSAFSEPNENGQIGAGDKRHQSIKKLLTNASVDVAEGRELRDITASWKE